jgi:hypothetical protein
MSEVSGSGAGVAVVVVAAVVAVVESELAAAPPQAAIRPAIKAQRSISFRFMCFVPFVVGKQA